MILAMRPERLRILFFERGENGGSVLSLSKLVEGLAPEGCDLAVVSYFQKTAPVDISSLQGLSEFHCLGAPLCVRPRPEVARRTIGVPHPTRFGLRYLSIALRTIRRFRPHVVYLNNGIAPHLPALAAARMLNVPVVCHLRSAQRLQTWERALARSVNRFVILTQWARAFYRDQGIPLARSVQLYNPFRFDAFDRACQEPLRAPLAPGPIYAVQAGTLRAHKRPRLAIEAFALAHARCPALRVVFAGDGPARPELEAIVRSGGLDGFVHFLGHCDQMPALLSRCHIGLLVSRSEGQPNCVMEYMAARLPVVTWNMGGIDELVEDGTTGLITLGASPTQIARGLMELYESAELRRSMGGAGRRKIASDAFSPERHFRRIRQMLEEVASGQPASGVRVLGS